MSNSAGKKTMKQTGDEIPAKVLRTKVAAALMPSFLSPSAVNWDHGPETLGKIHSASLLAVVAADDLLATLEIPRQKNES